MQLATKLAHEEDIVLSESSSRVTVIEAKRGIFSAAGFRELWQYRAVFWLLSYRNIKVRYAQTVLGALWVVFPVLLSTGIFSIIFGKMAQIPSEGVPYPIFTYVGLVPWTFFTSVIMMSSFSLVAAGNLISKVFIPRLIMPMVALSTPIVDIVIRLGVMALLFWYFKFVPPVSIIWKLPAVCLLMAFFSFGIGLWFSAGNVRYRDVAAVVPLITQIGLFLTPILYPISMVPEKYQWIASLNPVIGIVTGFRNACLGTPVHTSDLIYTVVFTVVLTISGMFYFKKIESIVADVI